MDENPYEAPQTELIVSPLPEEKPDSSWLMEISVVMLASLAIIVSKVFQVIR